MPQSTKPLALLVALAALAPLPAPATEDERVVSVQPVLGVPSFMLNGQVFMSPAFETYVPTENYFRQFAEAGTRLFSFNTNAAACDYGHSTPSWVSADVWDYSQFDERARRVLAANPDALLIPRINLGTPRWWLEEHPDTWERFADGSAHYPPEATPATVPSGRPFPSLASPEWRSMITSALRKFLDHVDQSPYREHIFGYMLAGMHTEEWYHWSAGGPQCAGYSASTVEAFRAWLRITYRTDDALRKAWKSDSVNLANAEVPSCELRRGPQPGSFRAEPHARQVADFYTFYNELIPDTIAVFARTIREHLQRPIALGVFYGYMYEFLGDPEFGHNALGQYLKQDELDFIFVTASYFNRSFAQGADYPRSPWTSVQLHGKVWYHDNDVVSFLAPTVLRLDQPGNEAHPIRGMLPLLGYTDTATKTRWMYQRAMGFALGHGFYTSFFDLHGGYFDHPELMEEIGQLTRIAEKSAQHDRSSVAEILIVADEKSCAYVSPGKPLLQYSLQAPQLAFMQLGSPVDQMLLDDLDKAELAQYKLVVFLNCYRVDSGQRAIIDRLLKRDNKTLMWCYAPGYVDSGAYSLSATETLIGMKLDQKPTPDWSPLQVEFKSSDHELAQALAAAHPGIAGPSATGLDAFYVSDPDAIPLGYAPETQRVAMAIKDHGNWKSLYSVTPNLPAAIYRAIANDAGVHLFNHADDTLYVNASYITLHGQRAGERTLHFPVPVSLHDPLNDATIAAKVREHTVSVEEGETVMLRWTPINEEGGS